MSTALATQQDRSRMIAVLESSLYPGAQPQSIEMVLGYCEAAGLDPMLKPVHIVPVFDSKRGGMRDVIMPGVGLYRTQASRTGQFAGMSEPEFGPDVTDTIGGATVTYPEWCRVTVRRALPSGIVAEFTAREYWLENYAIKGGKDRSVAPNAMWSKRPRGQLAKCASAQALRIAFPELGAQATADEMEGKALHPEDLPAQPSAATAGPEFDRSHWLGLVAIASDEAAVKTVWASAAQAARAAGDSAGHAAVKSAVTARLDALKNPEAVTVEYSEVQP